MRYIYIIKEHKEDTDFYKIGYSKNVNRRIKQIQTCNANKISIHYKLLTKHYSTIEASLHSLFKDYRVSNEWFELNSVQVEKIISIIEKSNKNLNLIDNDLY